MEFKFTGSVYVEEEELKEICELIKMGMPIDYAINIVASKCGNWEWSSLDYIRDDLEKEIEKRLDK